MRLILVVGSFFLLASCGGSSGDGTTAAKARGMSMPAAISAVPAN